MSESIESSRDRAENQIVPRILNREERELLERKHGLEILEDKPELLYCVGQDSPLRFIDQEEGLQELKRIVEESKAIIFEEQLSKKVSSPTLNEAIDLIVERRGLIQSALEKHSHLKLDRGAMDKVQVKNGRRAFSDEEKDLLSTLSHNNGYNYCDAFTKDKEGRTKSHIYTFAPKKLSEPFQSRLDLEVASMMWLEPHGRSKPFYEEAGFEKDQLSILEDVGVLKKAIEVDSNNLLPVLQKIIDTNFDGNILSFQKRWKEYYENWWPTEYQVMQDAIDRTKELLKTQKD